MGPQNKSGIEPTVRWNAGEPEVLPLLVPLDQLSDEEIWSAVKRIENSRTLKGCTKLLRLLSFVVKATLEGESDYLKETMIGVYVFGRKPDYDPKIDTIVRSQAWRLRAKLKKYYIWEGLQDPLIIDLPRGRYVPVFYTRKVANC